MDDTTPPQPRRFHPTPTSFLLLLLAVEVLLWLSNWLGWPAWHKGYAVLVGVAVVGVVLAVLGIWFLAALAMRRRFGFGVWSLLLLAAVVALPGSWLAVEMKKATEQAAAVARIRTFPYFRMTLSGGAFELYDYQYREADNRLLFDSDPPGPECLRTVLGVDFFANVVVVDMSPRAGDQRTDDELACLQGLPQVRTLNIASNLITDVGLRHLTGLSHLRTLYLRGNHITDAGLESLSYLRHLEALVLVDTKVTAAGVAKLQQALPNCKITR